MAQPVGAAPQGAAAPNTGQRKTRKDKEPATKVAQEALSKPSPETAAPLPAVTAEPAGDAKALADKVAALEAAQAALLEQVKQLQEEKAALAAQVASAKAPEKLPAATPGPAQPVKLDLKNYEPVLRTHLVDLAAVNRDVNEFLAALNRKDANPSEK